MLRRKFGKLQIDSSRKETSKSLFKNIKVNYLPKLFTPVFFTFLAECIRYLDVHSLKEDTTSPEQKTAINALLAPLLLNASLAVLRLQPPNLENAEIAVKYTSRALDELELNNADKGEILFSMAFLARHQILNTKTFQPRHIIVAELHLACLRTMEQQKRTY
jgi:hypothetical protein